MNTQTQSTKKASKKAPLVPQAHIEEKAVAVQQEAVNLEDWGVPELNSRDIVIPKIFTMQAMSKKVTEGKAKFGEFRDSLNNELLGSDSAPLEFIPFYMEKCYVVMREEKGKFKFNRTIAITAANEDEEFEQETNEGVKEKWYRTQNFYILRPEEIKTGDAVPYLLSFRSTSAPAGLKIATQMYLKNIKAKASPAAMVMTLSGTKTTNDKGTFIVMDAVKSRPSTQTEIGECLTWVKTIRAGQVKVDHSDLAEAAVVSTPEPESTEY